MRAVIARGPRTGFALSTTHPLPRLGESTMALLKVAAVGVCASDAKMFDSATDFYWDKEKGRVASSASFKSSGCVVPGHEFVGEVVEALPGAICAHGLALRPGDRIAVQPGLSCGQCWSCAEGNHHKCDSLRVHGQGIDGGMAQFAAVRHGAHVHRLPPRSDGTPMSWREAVLTEPLSVALHAVDRASDELKRAAAKRGPSDRPKVAVAGCGTIGLAIIFALRHELGDSVEIIGIDPMAFKLDAAKRAGADQLFDPTANRPFAELAPARGGVDVYFEASGSPKSLTFGVAGLRKMGKLVHLGIWDGGSAPVNWNDISAFKELEIVGASLSGNQHDRVFPRVLEMLAAGAIDPAVMISHELPLTDYRWALEAACGKVKGEEMFKVVLYPQLEGGAPRIVPS